MELSTLIKFMHLFELCNHIKEKPALFLDGEKSIRRLSSFINGYQAGVGYQAGGSLDQLKLTGAEGMREFNSWVAKQLGFSESTSGWCNMILSKAGSDKKAFNLFFELLDKYRNETSRESKTRS
jgi:hypothetical protein